MLNKTNIQDFWLEKKSPSQVYYLEKKEQRWTKRGGGGDMVLGFTRTNGAYKKWLESVRWPNSKAKWREEAKEVCEKVEEEDGVREKMDGWWQPGCLLTTSSHEEEERETQW